MQLQSPVPGSRFIDPAVLAKIGNLEFVARSVVDGVINGSHRSPYFGASVDFAEHRGYVPGDDIRRVDWRVFARTDKYYIKEFEADSNANFSVLLDVSKSMGFGTKLSKLDYARTLAACLAYLANAQRDRVGLITFDSEVIDHVPPSAKHLDVVLHTLDRAKPQRPGQLVAPLRKLAEHFGRRGIIVVISDFYAEPEEIFHAVAPIVHRGNDVALFHVLDPQEIDFSFADDRTLQISATVQVEAKKGVEMEALTAVSVAALTVYDMCKSVDRGISIGPIQLDEKTGGRSGHWRRTAD